MVYTIKTNFYLYMQNSFLFFVLYSGFKNLPIWLWASKLSSKQKSVLISCHKFLENFYFILVLYDWLLILAKIHTKSYFQGLNNDFKEKAIKLSSEKTWLIQHNNKYVLLTFSPHQTYIKGLHQLPAAQLRLGRSKVQHRYF